MSKQDIAKFDLGAGSRHPAFFFSGAPNYDAQTSRYNPAFVNPSHWKVIANAWDGLSKYIKVKDPTFQALQIAPGEDIFSGAELIDIIGPGDPVVMPEEIASYEWLIKKMDGTFEDRAVKSKGDARSIVFTDFKVPELGKYQVTLTVRFKDNTVVRKQNTLELRDFLVVCIGDSFASGEGVPDFVGIPSPLTDPLCGNSALAALIDKELPVGQGLLGKLPGMSMDKEPVWQEPKAHRSIQTCYSSHAARIAELNRTRPGDMITYLNFARSGSEIRKGLIDPKDSKIDVGQIDEIKRTIGDRTIDALIVSIGVNDVAFEGVMKDIVFDDSLLWPSVRNVIALSMALGNFAEIGRERVVEDVGKRIDELRISYATLQGFLTAINPKRVYLVEYPEGLFDKTDANGDAFVDSGCGVFNAVSLLNVDRKDAEALKSLSQKLNEAMREASKSHNWRFIGGVAQAFEGKGYCAGSDSFFVTATDSCKQQGDLMGMVHPNFRGHLAVGEIVAGRLERDLLRVGFPFKESANDPGETKPENKRPSA